MFLTFHGIDRGIAKGMAKVYLPLVKILSSNDDSKVIYYVGHYRKRKGEHSIYNFSYVYRLFVRINSLLTEYLWRDGYLRFRLRNEKALDFIASYKINRSQPLITSALLLRSNLRRRNKKGRRIFIAGNPHDQELFSTLKREEELNNIILNDTYLNLERLEFVSKSIASFDFILCFNRLVYDSYCKYIGESKVMFFSKHILPSFDLFPEVNITKSEVLSFCFVAHPTWLKGLPYLLEAWRLADLENAELRIGGALNEDLKKLVESKFAELNNVHFLGHIDASQLNIFYRYSHVCVVPSLLDASPTTVLEGMYCGLPCIVSRGCGNFDLVTDFKSGITVAPASADEIAYAMNWFDERREYIETFGQNAKAVIKSEILKEEIQNHYFGDYLKKIS